MEINISSSNYDKIELFYKTNKRNFYNVKEIPPEEINVTISKIFETTKSLEEEMIKKDEKK